MVVICLNLACGKDVKHGWHNLDKNPESNQVIHCDLLNGIPYEDGCVDEIFCSHYLEHLKLQTEAIPFLKECERVLTVGGILTLITPDLEQIRKRPVDMDKFASIMFGDGRTAWDYHASGWYQKRLEKLGRDGHIHLTPEAGLPVFVWERMCVVMISTESRPHSPYEITAVYKKE